MRRIPALDGLRGIAILLVLISHSWTSTAFNFWPHIGWSGVELFFVLSGYLITSILLDARGAPAYFRTFFARRILRIFPLYYVVVAVMFFMVACLPAAARPELGIPRGHQWAYWLFLSNVSMAAAGTFALSAAGVTWSLAVEEQFYLLWAPIVRLLRTAPLVFLLVGICLAALVWRVALYASHGWTLAGLVLLPSQMDALAAGALVAMIRRNDVMRIRASGWVPPLVAVSAGGILYGALRAGTFYSQDATTWILSLSLYPLLYGSVLMLAVSATDSSLSRMLGVPILRAFGRYSYAIYLLHRPLLIGMNMVGLGALAQPGSNLASQVTYSAILLAVSFLVGWISWCLLEQPAQRLKRSFEAGERGADTRDTYALEGVPAVFTLGPWRLERPDLGIGVNAARVLLGLRPSRAMVLPGLVALALLSAFLTGPATGQTSLAIAILLLCGLAASVVLAPSRIGFLPAALIIGVVLLATPHGLIFIAFAAIFLIPTVLLRAQSRRLVGRAIGLPRTSHERLS